MAAEQAPPSAAGPRKRDPEGEAWQLAEDITSRALTGMVGWLTDLSFSRDRARKAIADLVNAETEAERLAILDETFYTAAERFEEQLVEAATTATFAAIRHYLDGHGAKSALQRMAPASASAN